MSARRYREADIRRLCAESMNNCMFRDCRERLVMEDTFVAEICHIEAASPNGPRYNPNMSDEERDGYDNLILMCRNHHKVIDNNEQKYTVAVLHQMKEEHLRRGAGSVPLNTKLIIPCDAGDAVGFAQYCFGEKATEEEIESVRDVLIDCQNRIKKIPVRSREVFVTFVEKAYKLDFGGYVTNLYEVNSIIGLSKVEFINEISILNRHDLVSDVDIINDTEEVCWLQGNRDNPEIWMVIREFCELNGINLREVIVNLDFSVFDGEQ